MTKQDVVDQVALMLNRPNDLILKNALGDIVVQQLNMFLRRSVARHGVDDSLILPFYSPVHTINKDTHMPITGGGPLSPRVSKSTLRIPTPLRYDTDTPFIRVASIEDVTFPYRPPYHHNKSYLASLPFVDLTIPEYTIINNFLIFSAVLTTSEVVVYQLYSNPDEAIDNYYARLGFVFDEQTAFPYPADLVGDITTSILKGNLAVPEQQE